MIVIRKKNTIHMFILDHADEIVDIIGDSLEEISKEFKGYNLNKNSEVVALKVGNNVYKKFPDIIQFKYLTNDDYKYIGRECMNMLVQVLADVTEEELIDCGIDATIVYKN